MCEPVPKPVGERVTKTRGELSSSGIGEAVPEPMTPATRGKTVESGIWPVVVIIRGGSITRRDTAIARIVVVARRAGVLGGRGLCSRRWRAAKHDGRSVFSGCRLSVGRIRTADHDCCWGGATRIGLRVGRLGSGQCSRGQADTAYQHCSSDQPFAAVHRSPPRSCALPEAVTHCYLGSEKPAKKRKLTERVEMPQAGKTPAASA